VIIELERRLVRQVPVISTLSIQLQPGYTIVGGIKLKPPRVTVSGPSSVVDTLKSLHTQPLFFSHVHANLSGQVRVEIPKDRHLSVFPREVSYFVNVQQLGEKVIHDIPVTIIHAPRKKKLRVIPSTISVTIEGGIDWLNTIQAKDIHVYIDYRKKNQRGDNYRAIIELPPETRFSDAFPHTFKIVAEK
jgi:YbbR domain-containing protein